MIACPLKGGVWRVLQPEILCDRLYARLANRATVFPGGWGCEDTLERAGTYFARASSIDIRWQSPRPVPGGELRSGTFFSPYAEHGLPAESHLAHVEWLLPEGWSHSTPVAIHFASTGDVGFVRRRKAAALPLLRHGIGSVILENPFYGPRRPDGQVGATLRSVSDLWCMGMALWEEGRALLDWLTREGFDRLGVCGVSLGGQIASQVASLWPGPLAMATLVAPHNANVVYVDGILRPYLNRAQLSGHARCAEAGSPEAALGRVLDPTDIRRFPIPERPDACIRIGALFDAYVPPASVSITHEIWPGSELRWIPTCHVRAVAYGGGQLVGPLREAFSRL